MSKKKKKNPLKRLLNSASNALESRVAAAALLGVILTHQEEFRGGLQDLTYEVTDIFNAAEEQKPEMLKKVAYHEAGHAILTLINENKSGVALDYATTIPRKNSLGHISTQKPEYGLTLEACKSRIILSYGGHTVETLLLGHPTAGPRGDIEMITSVAQNAIMEYGLSENVTPLDYQQLNNSGLLSADQKEELGKEIQALIHECYTEAQKLTISHAGHIETLAEALLVNEKMEANEIKALLGYDENLGLKPKAAAGDLMKPDTNPAPEAEEPTNP